MQEYKQASKLKYILVMISMCGLIASNVGLNFNVAGLFFNPIAEEFNVLKGTVSLTLTICNLVFALGGMAAPGMLKRVNVKVMILIGMVGFALSTALLSFASSIGMLYVLNAVRGFASGLAGFVLITMVMNHWFHKNSALITSITLGFSGLAGALFSPIVANIITQFGWRKGYLFEVLLIIILHIPAVLFLPCVDPHEKGLLAYGEDTTIRKMENHDQESGMKVGVITFILVCLLSIFSNGITSLSQHFPGIAENYELSTTVGTTMLSVCMIVNTSGKMLFGALVDRIGTKKSIILYTVLLALGFVIMFTMHSDLFMLVGSGLFGLVYALAAVGMVVITKDVYGIHNYAKTFPTINLAGVVSAAAFSSIIGFMYDFTGNYQLPIMIMLVFTVLFGVISLVVYKKK